MSTYRLNTLAAAVAFAVSAPSIVSAQEAPVEAAISASLASGLLNTYSAA